MERPPKPQIHPTAEALRAGLRGRGRGRGSPRGGGRGRGRQPRSSGPPPPVSVPLDIAPAKPLKPVAPPDAPSTPTAHPPPGDAAPRPPEADSPPRKAETKAEKRAKIAAEVLHTEVLYVKSLEIMIENYMKPLLIKVRTNVIENVAEEDVKSIFSNVEEFFPINQHMATQFNEVVEDWDESSTIGDIFLLTAPFFKVYNRYGNNYEHAIATLDKCMEEPTFAAVVEALAAEAPDSVSLESLLIMPVQRIPRYNLLLRDLLGKTESNHPDHSVLTKALELYEDVMTYLDADITEDEQRKKFMRMSNIRGAQELIKAHRKLLKEEVVTLAGDKFQKSKLGFNKDGNTKVQLWLFNDVVSHLKTSKSKSKTNIASAKHTWPLNLTWLKDQKDDQSDPKNPCSFALVGPLKTLNLRFPNQRAKMEWFKAIDEAAKAVLNEQIAPDDVTRYGRYTFPDDKGEYDGWWCFGRIHGKGRYKYLGNSYYGDWEYNCKSGQGRMELVGGEIYEGAFMNDKPHGMGKFVYSDGSTYEGVFVDGMRNGTGRFRYASGDEYNGRWKDNFPSGDGSYFAKAGFQYAGMWQAGKLHGNGRLVSPNGRFYEGDFVAGVKEGYGKLDYGNGDVYIGQWKSDKRHGWGLFYSPVEGKYEGYWANDLREGPGRMEYLNGNFYEGSWKRGQWSGRGLLKCAHGGVASYEGEWSEGLIHGKGHLVYRTGDSFVGHFKDNQLEGTGKFTSLNTVVFDGKWVDGMRDGKCALLIGAEKYSMTVKDGMMDEGERSFMAVPDMPMLHFDL